MNIAEFLPEVYLEASECPEAVALNAVRNTLREFCELTKAWRVDLDPVTMIAGFGRYDIDTPPDTELVMVLSATYDGKRFDKIFTLDELGRECPAWRTEHGAPMKHLAQEWNTLVVAPIPITDDPQPIYLMAAVKPTPVANTCGDILDQWREGIVAGALARLKAIPDKAWTDRDGAAYYRNLFDVGVSVALARIVTGHAKRPLRVQRPFRV